jgi:hypothetical protein
MTRRSWLNAEQLKEALLKAEHGDKDAQYSLGQYYRYLPTKDVCQIEPIDEEDHRNKQEAVKWYKLAANQGHQDAAFYLGSMYRMGTQIKKDLKEAVKWYIVAVENGSSSLISGLTDLYNEVDVEDDVKEMLKPYRSPEQEYPDRQELSIKGNVLTIKGKRIELERPVKSYAVLKDRIIILYDPFSYDQYRKSYNLNCLDREGNLIWTAKSPDRDEIGTYDFFRVHKDYIEGFYPSYLCKIDKETGKMEAFFTRF